MNNSTLQLLATDIELGAPTEIDDVKTVENLEEQIKMEFEEAMNWCPRDDHWVPGGTK